MTHNHKTFQELMANIRLGLDTYIHGPTGSGKTHAISQAAKELGLPFYKKIVGATMNESAIMGYTLGHEYIEGIAFKPFTQGGVLLLDEVDNGNANTNLIINGLCDGELAFPCGMYSKHPNFRLVTTANTLGQGPSLNYIGRNKQDASLLNRLVFVFWPYDDTLTYKFCSDITYTKKEWEREFDQIWFDVEKIKEAIEELKIPHIISPRTMKQVAIKVAGERSREEILNSVILKGLTKEQKKRILDLAKNKSIKNFSLPKYERPRDNKDNGGDENKKQGDSGSEKIEIKESQGEESQNKQEQDKEEQVKKLEELLQAIKSGGQVPQINLNEFSGVKIIKPSGKEGEEN